MRKRILPAFVITAELLGVTSAAAGDNAHATNPQAGGHSWNRMEFVAAEPPAAKESFHDAKE